MGSEDHFLNLDPYQCNKEIEFLLKIVGIDFKQATELYNNNEISASDYEYAKSYLAEDRYKEYVEERMIKSSEIYF